MLSSSQSYPQGLPQGWHSNGHSESLLKQAGVKGVRNVVQHPRREMWGARYTEAIMSSFVKALCLQMTET